MVESRCGILCSQCEYRESLNCEGCVNIDKPFWGDSCPVKNCCEGRVHDHCGQCSDFPCALLAQFAYDVEQGDNGKRIEICRGWVGKEQRDVNPFNVGHFIQAVAKQNAEGLQEFFTSDAVIYWHDSNEQFTVDEYIRANCEYPGAWDGEIQRVERIEGGIVMVTKIISIESSHLVTAFAKLTKGKISRLDEYYSDCNEVPKWRKDMKIGTPIA